MGTQNTTSNLGLVFTMHKVGSSTIMEAFRQAGLNPERGYERNVKDLQDLKNYRVVVTPVRDPIARNVSYFFEMNGQNLSGMSMGEVYDEMVSQQAGAFTYPLTWFDNVYKKVFGVNVYRHLFSKKRGWAIIRRRYLLVQTERMSEVLPDAFESLLGVRIESVHRARTTETRPYGELYKQFVDWVRFPNLDIFYNSKYVRHFYSNDQIREMRSRWEI